MKSVPLLAGFCAVLGAAPWLARADNAPPPVDLKSTSAMQAPHPNAPAEITPPSTSASPLDASYFSTTDPEQIAEQTLALHQQQQNSPNLPVYDQEQRQQAYDNDWMLRDYTARLKSQGMANTPETDPSMLPQPVNPNASLASQDPLLPQNQARPQKSRAPRSDDASTDPTSNLTPNSALAPAELQPLLPPLNPIARHTAPQDPWGSPDAVAAGDLSSANTTYALAPNPSPDMNSDDSSNNLLDSPGMTAQQEGLIRGDDLNLPDQDPMPDVVNTDRSSTHVNRNTNFLVPTTPTSDVAEFFKKQAEALAPPMPPTVGQPAQAPGLAKPPPPVGTPEPFAKPTIGGFRTHVPDPFDILNR